jgi:hypothetical protein
MKKLPKATIKLIEEKCGELRGAGQALAEALQEAHDDAQEYFDDRSENWQEGERGEAYQEWIDSLDALRDTAEGIADIADELDDVPEAPE